MGNAPTATTFRSSRHNIWRAGNSGREITNRPTGKIEGETGGVTEFERRSGSSPECRQGDAPGEAGPAFNNPADLYRPHRFSGWHRAVGMTAGEEFASFSVEPPAPGSQIPASHPAVGCRWQRPLKILPWMTMSCRRLGQCAICRLHPETCGPACVRFPYPAVMPRPAGAGVKGGYGQ